MNNIINTESSASSAGYKYQDIVALNSVVNLLTDNTLKKVIIDKDNTPHIEDVVLEYIDKVEYLQVKHSNSEIQETFKNSDLFCKEKSLFSKTFIGWQHEKTKFDTIKIVLLVNKTVSTQKSKGFFSTKKIVESINYTRDKKSAIDKLILEKMQSDLKDNGVKFTITDIKLFLKDLYFKFNNPPMEELLKNIEEKLKGIIQTPNIINHLNTLYKEVSLDATANSVSKRTYTKEKVERILDLNKKQKFTHFYDIPKNYIDIENNFSNLYRSYKELSKGYIFFKGKAGSGKTSFITKFLSEIEKEDDIAVLRYYLFHFDDKSNEDSSERVIKNYFYYDLSIQLRNYLSSDFVGEIYLNEESNNYELFWNNLEVLARKFKKVIIVVDGIDHAIRAKRDISTFFDGLKLPNQIINNVICILSGQSNWKGYPSWLKKEDNSEYFKSVEIEPFPMELCKQYIESLDYWSDGNLVDFLSYRSYEITKGYPLNLKIFIDTLKNINSIEEIEKYLQSNNYFDNFENLEVYYDLLFEDVKLKYFENNGSELLKFQALLCLLKEPINAETIEAIFSEIDIYKYSEIISKIKPILLQKNDGNYELFHNDIRVYLHSKIDISIRKDMIRRIANYYMDNIESKFSQKYLIKYLYDLKDYESIKKLLTFDRLDLKYKLLRTHQEIINELNIGIKVAKEQKDPYYLLEMELVSHQHNMVINNLEGSGEFDFDLEAKKVPNLYSFIAPSKEDISYSAINKRKTFFNIFSKLELESLETKKYFFYKFSFNIIEYLKDIDDIGVHQEDSKEFFYQYFYTYLQIDKESSINEFKEIQDLYEVKDNFSYIRDCFFYAIHDLFELDLEQINYFRSIKISVSIKSVVSACYYFYKNSEFKKLENILKALIENGFLSNNTIYIAYISGLKDLLPSDYEIKSVSDEFANNTMNYRNKVFKWAYISTNKYEYKNISNLFSKFKFSRFDSEVYKANIFLGYLSAKNFLSVSDIDELFFFIDNQKHFNFSQITESVQKFLEIVKNNDIKIHLLNTFAAIEERIKDYDEFIFAFYKWCEEYNFNTDKFTLRKLENDLKNSIHGLETYYRQERVHTLINIKKHLHEDVSEYQYFLRKYSLGYGFRKDYQSEYFMAYFTNLLKKDYNRYIDIIYEFLFIEQFKQNEQTEKTTTLEQVLEEILLIVAINSKADLFNILEYFFKENNGLEIPTELFLRIIPNTIQNEEDAITAFSLFKMGTTFSQYNNFRISDEKIIENLSNELKKFDISCINIFKDNIVNGDNYNTKEYNKIIERKFIELMNKLVKDGRLTYRYWNEETALLFYNIQFHADLYFEKVCESNQSFGIEAILEVLPFMNGIDLDKMNNLVLTYLDNLYSNVNEDIETIQKKYATFNIEILLNFLTKYLYCINPNAVVSAIQSYIQIGEFFIDEVVEFIFNSIDFNKLFHCKLWLDILIELPLNKYSNLDDLKRKIVEFSKKSNYVYLDYSIKKLFNILNMEYKKDYSYFTLDLPSSIIVEKDREVGNYKDFFLSTEYKTVKSFILKVNKITSLSEKFIFEKINFFKETKKVEVSYYRNCSKDIMLLGFDSSFYKSELVQYLYEENYIKKIQKDYLMQIIQGYDLNVVRQENYKPFYIKNFPNVDIQEELDTYIERLKIEDIITDVSKVFSGNWEEKLERDYIIRCDINTFILKDILFKSLKGNLDILEKFYFNFGVDSYYLKDKNPYHVSISTLNPISLTIKSSTKCFSNTSFQNSQLIYIPNNSVETNLIRWNYGNSYSSDYHQLHYQGFGQINELASEVKIQKDEVMIKICELEIFHKENNEKISRVFLLKEKQV